MTRRIFSLAAAFAACAGTVPMAAQVPAAQPDSIYALAQVEVRPEALNGEELGAAVFAKYPPRLREAGVSGEVTVSLVVGSDGLPRNVELVSSTDTLFNAPTLEAVSLLRFSPAKIGGRPVAVRVVFPVPWTAGPAPEAPGPDSTGTYALAEVEVQPRPVNREDLQRALERSYPPELKDAGTTGVVQVRFRISPDGLVTNPRVTNSTDPRFNDATLAAVQVLRFRPAQIGRRRVAVWVELPIQWSIVP